MRNTLTPAIILLVTATITAYQGRAGGPPAAGVPPAQGTGPAQNQPPEGDPTAVISGVVIDGGTGQPVPGAIVSMSVAGRSIPMGNQTRQLTDDKGRFAFVNVWGENNYLLSASKFGYLDGGVGREKSPTDPIRSVRVLKDQWLGGVRVTIWRPATISGSVRDESGEPMVGIIVRTLVRHRLMGRDELAAGPMTLTDDRGTYRIAGLVPGRYLVQVPSVQASMPTKTRYTGPGTTNAPDGGLELDEQSRLVIGRYPLPPPPMNGKPRTYPMAFHPATSSIADAITLDLKYGDDRPNIDITLSPVSAVRVSGVLEGPPEAMTLMTVRLLAAGLENLGQGSETATALVDPSGQFTFVNVPPGTYTIDAPVSIYEFTQGGSGVPNRPASFPSPPGIQGWSRSSNAPDGLSGLSFSTTNLRGGNDVPNYSGRATITVGSADMNGVVVRLKPMGTMTGKFVLEFDPTQPVPATPPRVSATLDAANGEVYLGQPRSQSVPDAPVTDFLITGVMPGQYWLRASPGWLVKSVVWKGRDYTTTPIDTTNAGDVTGVVVTVTNNRPTLSGVVTGTATLKAEDCMIVMFPVERAQWQNIGLTPARFKSAVIGTGDSYTTTSLPAGDYIVAAIDRTIRSRWLDPSVLTQLEAGGARVTLAWGAKATLSVPVVVVK
ncbi:MAG TPA: hypothetical protein VFV78_09140 [Vicinamibacterales bacterium]|nr:hypothetical protein [Vicinamibacterales bacterium]